MHFYPVFSGELLPKPIVWEYPNVIKGTPYISFLYPKNNNFENTSQLGLPRDLKTAVWQILLI